MTLRVAVDFGTSSTCVVASVNGRDPQVVVIDGHPLLSSAVYAAADGSLFVGQEAERQAAVDPARYEPTPKRRIDEGELLLGDTVLRVLDVVHAVLRRAVAEARRLASGAQVDLLVLTHPADWGAVRTRLLRQAAGQLAHEVALVAEPVAAAVFHASTFASRRRGDERTVELSGQPGDTLAVLDLGGGTVDVSVARRRPHPDARGGFEVLANRGESSFGGADIDQALLEYVGSLVSATDQESWRKLVEGRELTDRRRRVLRQDVRGAKESLSRHAYTDVPLPPPFADAHVTRDDLERLVAVPLGRVVELTVAAIDEAGLRAKQLAAIFLVGGSSRIPMVSRLVHERCGVVPTTLDQPETVVARGALRAVQTNPDRTGALPGTSTARSGTRGPDQQRTNVVGPNDIPQRRPSSAPRGQPPGPPPSTAQPVPRRGPPPSAAGGAPPSGGAQPAAPPHAMPRERADRNKRRGWPWIVGGAVVIVAAVVTTLVLTLDGGEADPPQPAANGRPVANYDYRFVAPADWTQTGGDVQQRKVVVRPNDAREAQNLIAVQEFTMDYDATADRQRLVDHLHGLVQQGPRHGDFDAHKKYAGKDFIYYRESKQNMTVDWYVSVQGPVRVHVGCQIANQAGRVHAACEHVARTLEIVS